MVRMRVERTQCRVLICHLLGKRQVSRPRRVGGQCRKRCLGFWLQRNVNRTGHSEPSVTGERERGSFF